LYYESVRAKSVGIELICPARSSSYELVKFSIIREIVLALVSSSYGVTVTDVDVEVVASRESKTHRVRFTLEFDVSLGSLV